MKIVVGEGSCGIAAGAAKVYSAIEKLINLTGSTLTVTGCIGMCFLEPIVDIYDGGELKKRLVKVRPEDAEKIIAYVNGDENAVNDIEISDDDKLFLEKQTRIALRHCGIINPEIIDEYTAFDGYRALEKVLKTMTPEDVIEEIKISGLAGRGGAGFPTHVKLNVPADKNIDTLIINAAECEPYITVDYRECIDNSWDICSGIKTVKELLNIPNVVIAVEDNKPDAFEILHQIVDKDSGSDSSIKIMQLKSVYPQGAEKMMVQSATGRQVPPGKLPADVGCIVMNVTSIAFIARYLKTGKPLVSRSMTVDGMAIAEPKNVRVPIGTSFADVVEFCGGFKEDPVKIIAGGPMMGMAITDVNYPISKSNNALLAFSAKDAKIFRETDCIRCGRCAAACPMSLVPTKIVRDSKAKDVDALTMDGVMVCMECGSCAYSCPAKKPLVQHMRLAKSIIREAGAKK